MNERIKELAEQAGYSKDFVAIGLPNNMEKFAELIVKECMNVLDPGEHQLIARFHTRQWLSEHFGVK
jgi:hypothetical protein